MEELNRFHDDLWEKAHRTPAHRPRAGARQPPHRTAQQVSPHLLMLVELHRDLRLLLDTYRSKGLALDARPDAALEDAAEAALDEWRRDLPTKLRDFHRS